MRTRKPVSATGPACHRCTAVLTTGVARCAICGWPAGVGYPPADGELETARQHSTPEVEPEAADDHADVQLEVLSGMVERQSQPVSPEAPSDVDSVTEPTQASDAPEDRPSTGEKATSEVDPLTAPLAVLTDEDSPASIPAEEATPIADEVAAEVVPTDESTSSDVGKAPAPTARADSAGVPTSSSRAPALSRAAQLLIVAAAVLNVVVAAISAVAGTPADSAFSPVILGATLLTLAVWTGSAVVFLHWVSRAYTYVLSTSVVRQRHGGTMALLGWFIPVVGVVIGYRVLQDLWSGSSPATRGDADAASPSARVLDIWLLGLVTAMIFGYAMPLALGESALWGGLASLGVAVAGVALASAVGTISEWQAAPIGVVDAASDTDTGTVSTRVDDLTAENGTAEEPTESEPEPSLATAD